MIDLDGKLPKEYEGYRGRDLALRFLQLNGIKNREQPKLWKDRVAEAEAEKKRYQQAITKLKCGGVLHDE